MAILLTALFLLVSGEYLPTCPEEISGCLPENQCESCHESCEYCQCTQNCWSKCGISDCMTCSDNTDTLVQISDDGTGYCSQTSSNSKFKHTCPRNINGCVASNSCITCNWSCGYCQWTSGATDCRDIDCKTCIDDTELQVIFSIDDTGQCNYVSSNPTVPPTKTPTMNETIYSAMESLMNTTKSPTMSPIMNQNENVNKALENHMSCVITVMIMLLVIMMCIVGFWYYYKKYERHKEFKLTSKNGNESSCGSPNVHITPQLSAAHPDMINVDIALYSHNNNNTNNRHEKYEHSPKINALRPVQSVSEMYDPTDDNYANMAPGVVNLHYGVSTPAINDLTLATTTTQQDTNINATNTITTNINNPDNKCDGENIPNIMGDPSITNVQNGQENHRQQQQQKQPESGNNHDNTHLHINMQKHQQNPNQNQNQVLTQAALFLL